MNRYQKAMQDTHLPEEARQSILNMLKTQEKSTVHPIRPFRFPALAAAVLAVVFLAGGALAAAKAGGFSAWFSDKAGQELSPNIASVIEELTESPSISVTDEGTTVAVESVYASDGIVHVMLKVTSETIDFSDGYEYSFAGRDYNDGRGLVMSEATVLRDGSYDGRIASSGGYWDHWKTDEENNCLYFIITHFTHQEESRGDTSVDYRDGHHVMHFELHGIDKRISPVEIEEYPGHWSFDVPLPATEENVWLLESAEVEARNYYSSGVDDPAFYLTLENIKLSASGISFVYQTPKSGNTYLSCVFDMCAVMNDGSKVYLTDSSKESVGTLDGSVSRHLYWEAPIDISLLDRIECYGSVIDIPEHFALEAFTPTEVSK